MTTEIHQTAHSESNNIGCFEVAIRTREAEAAYRGHDQRRADNLQRPVADADPIKISGRPIFNQYVGVRCQSAECGLPLGGLEIEDDTFLVRVIPSKRQAAVRMHNIVFERTLASHRIAFRLLPQKNLPAADVLEERAATTPPRPA